MSQSLRCVIGTPKLPKTCCCLPNHRP